MEGVIENYYSCYDEMETDNPDLGIVLNWEKPDFLIEVG